MQYRHSAGRELVNMPSARPTEIVQRFRLFAEVRPPYARNVTYSKASQEDEREQRFICDADNSVATADAFGPNLHRLLGADASGHFD